MVRNRPPPNSLDLDDAQKSHGTQQMRRRARFNDDEPDEQCRATGFGTGPTHCFVRHPVEAVRSLNTRCHKLGEPEALHRMSLPKVLP